MSPLDTALPNDLSAFWMPFTDNRGFKADPRMVVAAKDMHYRTADGRQVLDSVSGLWCVNAGHTREPIVAAIREAAGTLDYAPSFNLSHPRAFEFAQRLTDLLPAGMDHVFFCNSGSEAVDTALKIALAYQRAIGQAGRTRLIGREKGYHGVGFGGISVGGLPNNRKAFALLPGVDHIRHTWDPDQAFTKGQPERGAELADDLERLVALHGAETIAAVIVEPVAGSAGVLPPPKGYLERLRTLCDRHGILLIFDEVITAFGRLGAPNAATRFGVTPDLMTMAKGLTNAAVPMGAVGVRSAIHDAIVSEDAPAGIELFHGYTYSAHPLAVAAGSATLQLYADEGLFQRAAELEPYWQDALHSLKDHPHVTDIRNLGLTGAVELASREGALGARAKSVFATCFDEGLMIRITGDILAFSPPLIVSKGQIDEIVGKVGDVLKRTR